MDEITLRLVARKLEKLLQELVYDVSLTIDSVQFSHSVVSDSL